MIFSVGGNCKKINKIDSSSRKRVMNQKKKELCTVATDKELTEMLMWNNYAYVEYVVM